MDEKVKSEPKTRGIASSIEFIPRQPSFQRILSVLASTRSDGMYTRFMFLGLLLEHPCSKVEAMKTLRITRPYLERILGDWLKLSLIDVRDISPLAKPKVMVYLKIRPVVKIERLDSEFDIVSDAHGLMNLSKVLVSPAKTRLLELLSPVNSANAHSIGPGSFLSALLKVAGGSKQALYGHLRDLISSGLVVKVTSSRAVPQVDPNRSELSGYQTSKGLGRATHPHSAFRVNFKSIKLELEPYNYSS
jgi:hypothetical protein